MYGQTDKRVSIVQHLEELRQRIIKVVIFFAVLSIVSFAFAKKIVSLLEIPAAGLNIDFVFLSPTEGFASFVRVSLLAGFIATVPFALFQAGRFLRPAVSQTKAHTVSVWLVLTLFFSILGIVFAFFVVIPFSLRFLMSIGEGIASPMISIGKYFSFVSSFLAISALVFEIPIVMVFLDYMGLLNIHFYRKNRKYVVLGIFIAAGVITPTQDVFNMLIFALPMWLLYESGIIFSLLVEKRKYGKRP